MKEFVTYLEWPDDKDPEGTVRETLVALRESCATIPTAAWVQSHIDRLLNDINLSTRADCLVVTTRLDDLRDAIVEELKSHVFLAVSPRFAKCYEQPEPPFGEKVVSAFPDAVRDIQAATRALAFEMWTASVFHSMRVVEDGLIWLGKQLQVQTDMVNWHNIIEGCEKKIEKMEQLPKSPARDADLKFYSECGSQFRYFKNAWRNHVMHRHDTYDEEQAIVIWRHVREFMQAVAKRAAP